MSVAREALDAGYGNYLLERKQAAVFNSMMFKALKEEVVSTLNRSGATDDQDLA
jgi:hypothetical protein